MSKASATSAPSGGPGTLRARLRLGAVLLLGVLIVWAVVLAVRLYFVPPFDAVLGALLGVLFGVVTLVYGLLTWAVVKQRRVGHILAIVVCSLAVVFAIAPNMQWIDWVFLAVNLAAAGLLLGCVPRRAAA